MPFELKRVSHVHFAMIEMALAGATNSQIAQAMSRTPESVGMIMRSPVVQNELALRRASQNKTIDKIAGSTLHEAKEKLHQAAADAVDIHVSLMKHSADERVKQVSASEILKRTYDRAADQAGNGQGSIAVTLGPGAMLNLQIALRESSGIPEPEQVSPTEPESSQLVGEPSQESEAA